MSALRAAAPAGDRGGRADDLAGELITFNDRALAARISASDDVVSAVIAAFNRGQTITIDQHAAAAAAGWTFTRHAIGRYSKDARKSAIAPPPAGSGPLLAERTPLQAAWRRHLIDIGELPPRRPELESRYLRESRIEPTHRPRRHAPQPTRERPVEDLRPGNPIDWEISLHELGERYRHDRRPQGWAMRRRLHPLAGWMRPAGRRVRLDVLAVAA